MPSSAADARVETGQIDFAAPISDVIARKGALSPAEIGRQVMERLRWIDRRESFMRRRRWARNILYDRGEQRIRWDSAIRGFVTASSNSRVKRHDANLLGVRGDHWVADLTHSIPFFSGVPENTDLESRSLGRFGEQVVMHGWRTLNLDLARSLAVRGIWTCGGGFIELGWDSTAGTPRPVYAKRKNPMTRGPLYGMGGTQAYQLDKMGQAKIERWEATGAPYAQAVSSLLCYAPLTVDRPQMEACPYFLRLEWASDETIRERADEDLPDDYAYTDDPEFAYVDDIINTSGERRGGDKSEGGLHLLVHYYERRSPREDFIGGKHWTVCSERSIKDEPLEGDGDRYPLFYFGGRPRERRFHCNPEIQDRIAVQRTRNDVRTNLVTWLGRYALPLTFSPKGSEVPEQLQMDGSTVFFNPIFGPPKVESPPPASPSLFNMLNVTMEELDDSDPPASRGQAVSAPSALYIAHLQDAAAKRFGPVVRQHAWSWARLGEFYLKIEAGHESDERLLAVVGRGRRPDLVRMRASASRLGEVRLIVQESSLVSAIPSARAEQLKGLLQDGTIEKIIGPPPWPAAVRRALIDFMKMPAFGEVEVGSSVVDDWTEGVLTRVIEEGQEYEDDPLMDDQEGQALLEALNVRKIASDRPDWTDDDVARVGRMKLMLEQRQQAAMQQGKAMEQEQIGVQVDAENQQEQGKAGARAAEKMLTAYAKAEADMQVQAQQAALGIPMYDEGQFGDENAEQGEDDGGGGPPWA